MIAAVIMKLVRDLVNIATETRLAKLDGPVSLPDGADWTAARAAKVDTINSRMPGSGTIPNTTQVPSSTDYTTARAGYLDNIKKRPQVKVQATGLVEEEITSISSAIYMQRFYIEDEWGFIDTDKVSGYRFNTVQGAGEGSYVDLVNISGAGWLFGCFIGNLNAASRSGALKIIVDGTTIYEYAYASIGAQRALVPLGMFGRVAGTTNVIRASMYLPVRFNTSLQIQYRGQTSDIYVSEIHVVE